MDFNYKVIKNRLGSLVANAIQKKIKEESSKENTNVPLSVLIVQTGQSTFTVNKSSQEVFNAIKSGRGVIYVFHQTYTAGFARLSSNIMNEGSTGGKLGILFVDNYMDGEFLGWIALTHTGNTITQGWEG